MCFFSNDVLVALIALLGVFIGSVLTYFFSILHARKIKRLDANTKFINTFLLELSDVYPTAINWPENIDIFLTNKFSALNRSIAEFRVYLSSDEKKSFDQTWFEYYCSTGRDVDKNCQSYLHYMNFIGKSNGKPYTQDGHKNLVKNIDRLLKFAIK